MVDDDVLRGNGGETVAAMLADAFREPRRIRLELQVRAVFLHQLPEVGDAEDALQLDDIAGVDRKGAAHHLRQVGRRALLDHHADHLAAAAALDRRLVEAHQVLGFLLDLDVAVADDAEGALPQQVVARKEQREKTGDHPFQGQETHAPPRQPHEARQHLRQDQQRGHRGAVDLPPHLEQHLESLVGNEG